MTQVNPQKPVICKSILFILFPSLNSKIDERTNDYCVFHSFEAVKPIYFGPVNWSSRIQWLQLPNDYPGYDTKQSDGEVQ